MSETTAPNPKPETQYYLVEQAREPVAGIRFIPYDIIGSILFGFYATSDPAEIAALDEVIKSNPRRGLQKIDYAEYEKMAQKKIPNFANSAQWRPRPVVTQPKESPSPIPPNPLHPTASPIKGNGAVVDPNPTPPPPEPETITAAPVASVQDALLVGGVAASPTNPPKPSRKSAKPAGS